MFSLSVLFADIMSIYDVLFAFSISGLSLVLPKFCIYLKSCQSTREREFDETRGNKRNNRYHLTSNKINNLTPE